MEAIRIAIIGLGPRGLSLLERLVHLLPISSVRLDVRVDLIDPRQCGQGSHSSQQPDHLLTNTVASQVSLAVPEGAVKESGATSLTEWARHTGYRRFGGRYVRVQGTTDAEGRVGDEISDDDHLPRTLLGEYLAWWYERIVRSVPENMHIEHHRRWAVDLIKQADGRFITRFDNGLQFCADYVFMATGHGTRLPTASDVAYAEFVRKARVNNPMLAVFTHPYPVERLGTISEDATVAVQGLGLTAYDVVSTLTTGRGGQFTEEQDGLRYVPTGREPKVLLFSRHCLPFAARGINQKGVAGRYQARFFTPQAVRALRSRAMARRGTPQLDFDEEVLPLIRKEMAYAYRSALVGREPQVEGFQPTVHEQMAISTLLDPLKGEVFSTLEAFKSFFCSMVEADLAQARKGNISGPVKAATDVLRDTREALREAVEFAGLTPASHKVYLEAFVATTNRISFGPPMRRNAELLALMEAGVVDIAGGPGNRVVTDATASKFCIVNQLGESQVRTMADVLVIARLDPYSPLTDASPLTGSLMRRRIVRPYLNGGYHPGGLDITPDMQVIDASGMPHRNLWAIGIPVEGPHFYTHALPRPWINSRFTQDAQRCVEQLLECLSTQQQPAPQARREQVIDE